MAKFPKYIQQDSKDCGATCIRIIAQSFGRNIPIQYLRNLAETTNMGSSLADISDASEVVGFKTIGLKCGWETLKEQVPLPCIAYWGEGHFVVVYKITKTHVFISDPASGPDKYTIDEFLNKWDKDQQGESFILVMEPTTRLYEMEFEGPQQEHRYTLRSIAKHLHRYKALLYQLVLGLILASILQATFPFLTQSIIDYGIKENDIHFVYLILLAQVALFMGKSAVEIIRGWILLHISKRLSITILSEFIHKILKLPMAFFDARLTGDILKRLGDHQRIERILTTSSLNTLFSLVSLFVMGGVLMFYHVQIFLLFCLGSAMYFGWIVLFLKQRKQLDYQSFEQLSKEQSSILELVNGMQEIKLNSAENHKKIQWESVQGSLYKLSIRSLALEQYQGVGSNFINEIKNIGITAFAATLVVNGELTLGMLLSISFIMGQLNAPLAQIIGFVRELQDAQIAVERLGTVQNLQDEENVVSNPFTAVPQESIHIHNLNFRYTGSDINVFNGLNLTIPKGKITAIVGPSGSGKSSMIKLLLKFYDPSMGKITVGNMDLSLFSHKAWRASCGVVMQEGYIFNDTIARNIAVGHERMDPTKLNHAIEKACLQEFIQSMPKNYHTRIGNEGVGLSAGQKQRILIARAIYKDPDYVFFDEATSALDTINENQIVKNLKEFFKDKTVVVVAHRLSTVKYADQIVVLDDGKIKEQGTHQKLTLEKGAYYSLIKNQLELGN